MSQPYTELYFRLDLSSQQVLAYYRGQAGSVQAWSLDGKQVRFPAGILRPHIRADGVRGLFVLRFDANHRVLSLRRVDD